MILLFLYCFSPFSVDFFTHERVLRPQALGVEGPGLKDIIDSGWSRCFRWEARCLVEAMV